MSAILFLIYSQVNLFAQDVFIDSLIVKISRFQTKGDTFYNDGLFKSQRIHLRKNNYVKEDNNIFFTGLICWTLQTLEHQLTLKNHLLVDSICHKAVRNYSLYRNKAGGVTYNFWQTNPSRHFPGDRYFSERAKYILPDDLDDTSILYLSNPPNDSTKHNLKLKIGENANREKKTIKNTFREYKHVRAYSTWFGKNMPVDFDLCVHTNALFFVLGNKFILEEPDIETIHLLIDMVKKNYHLKYPHLVAPHYQNRAVILYHLARLVALHSSCGLSGIREKIINDLQQQLTVSQHPMEKLILQSSLLRLGIKAEQDINIEEKNLSNFYFFVANMTSSMPNPFKRWLSKSKLTNFYYRSAPYYYALILENAVLKK